MGVRAVSLDVTGTLLTHRHPIHVTYASAASWARLENPPTAEELKVAFQMAYDEARAERPCFGHLLGQSSRQWWMDTARSALRICGRSYDEDQFVRFFRRAYQHYGSGDQAYELMPDAAPFLRHLAHRGLLVGITANTPIRTMEVI